MTVTPAAPAARRTMSQDILDNGRTTATVNQRMLQLLAQWAQERVEIAAEQFTGPLAGPVRTVLDNPAMAAVARKRLLGWADYFRTNLGDVDTFVANIDQLRSTQAVYDVVDMTERLIRSARLTLEALIRQQSEDAG